MDGNVWSPPRGSWASDEATRKKMLGNRSRDTKPEMLVRSLVHRRGLRYRVSQRPIANVRRTADLVFRRAKVAVNVDGCFWHGCEQHYKEPKTNTEYWRNKIDGNRRRDRETDELLTAAGWLVLRFWEHEDPAEVAETIEHSVRIARSPVPMGPA
ncbi:MAG: very short patch repair endonuclease [Acidimicrobiaceae bacterium]|nr:very short patch repair endonuclease [Acidimicrobiaceae bacterium]